MSDGALRGPRISPFPPVSKMCDELRVNELRNAFARISSAMQGQMRCAQENLTQADGIVEPSEFDRFETNAGTVGQTLYTTVDLLDRMSRQVTIWNTKRTLKSQRENKNAHEGMATFLGSILSRFGQEEEEEEKEGEGEKKPDTQTKQ